MNLIKGLTGLRGYAAFLVYLAHMYPFGYFGMSPAIAEWVKEFGPAGVSLFFVLSGFVLFINYPKDHLRFRRFYIARFARIYPAYLLGILIAVPLEIYSPEKKSQLISFFANVLLIQQYFPETTQSFNDVGWTLSVEAFFYLLFPFIAVFVIRNSFRRAVVCSASILLLSICWVWWLAPSFFAGYHFPPMRLFEFVLGMTGGLAFQKFSTEHISLRFLKFAFATSIIVFFGAAAFIATTPQFSQTPQFFFGPIGLIIIYSCACLELRGSVSFLLASHVAVFFGEISYSFYLFHNLALRYFSHGMRIIFSQDPATWGVFSQILSAILILIGTVGFSALVFRFIEIPARRIIRRTLDNTHRQTV